MPDARLLGFAERFFPGLRELKPREAQIAGLADVLGTLASAPFAALGLAWLAAATDVSLIAREWPLLLLLGGLMWVIQRLPVFVVVEVSPGKYGETSGSLERVLDWTAWLLFGPTALWLSLMLSGLDRVRNLRQLTTPQLRWLTARNDLATLVELTLAPLIAFWLYRNLGGTFPFPGLTVEAIGLALIAIFVRACLGSVLSLGYLVFFGRALGVLAEPQMRATYLRFTAIAIAAHWVADPFGILGAGLYVEHGLAAFLLFIVGFVLVGLLARQFSQTAERSRRQARQIERLEQLGRALLAAAPDASTLPEVLQAHLPGMFPAGRLEVRLFPDRLLALYPTESKPASPQLWPWLQDQTETGFFDAGTVRPWLGEPGPEIVLVTPILDEASRRPLGGLCQTFRRLSGFGQSMDARQVRELIPAAQSLAAQIASALHRADVYRDMLANQKRAQELEFAGRVQASFLPNDIPALPGWQVTATLDSARETSGDFFDFISLPEGRLGLVVADVTDKGTGAALYMALSRTLIRTYAQECYPDPVAALASANRRLLEDTRAEMFVTVFFGILDPANGQLTYCNAGHNAPFIFSAETPGLKQSLRRTGMPLGALDDAAWACGQTCLEPGEVLVLYTDGVTEAQNLAGELFGEARLNTAVLQRLHAPVAEMREAILTDLRAFAGDAPQSDDITLMVVARRSAAGAAAV
jgi:serine phosphatase RsbU (regulator of sigma subunit)